MLGAIHQRFSMPRPVCMAIGRVPLRPCILVVVIALTLLY